LNRDISHLTKLLKWFSSTESGEVVTPFHSSKVISKSKSVYFSNAFFVNTEASLPCLTFWMVHFLKSYFQTCACFETPNSIFCCVNPDYAPQFLFSKEKGPAPYH